MEDRTKRILAFVFLCLTTRVAAVLAARYVPRQHLPWLGALALLPAIGFFVLYIGDMRKTGAETWNAPIWWNHLRPIHAGLYLAFAVMAFKRSEYAWLPLAIDVLLGAGFFAHHHITAAGPTPHSPQD